MGMAQLLAAQAKREQEEGMGGGRGRGRRGGSGGENAAREVVEGKLQAVVSHLENAARGANAFAMFNLGIVHLYGYGVTGRKDPDLAGEWFEASGLPEGLFARALHARSKPGGDRSIAAATFEERARALGYGAPWRIAARRATGSGGSAGVDLNFLWPRNADGLLPPEW